ncbi:MAG: hypothetical protein KatS3mg009_0687 [Acidimicrobiia bacterium]|nr:MAG: hypothetical protein KatS3mg009_0687 [Acidimicrobiia bacterium]
MRLEARVVGGSVYFERAEADDATLTDPRLPAGERVFLRRAGEPTWLRRPARALALVHPAIVGPFELLDLLRAARAGLGTGRPDGERRRHDLDAAALRPLGASAATLWVGPDRRLARVRVEAAGATVDYEVTGYGAPVDVPAPAGGDVTDTGTAGGTAPAPAGPWVRVASGRHEGVPWALERAPASGGGDCWRFTSSPRLVATDVACIPVPPPSTPPPLAIEFPFTTRGAGPADVVVAVTAVEVTDARFLRLDGSALGAVASVAADGRGTIVWVGATRPPVVAASLTTAAGGVLSCGPGTVASVADAQGLTPAELDDARGYPWACTG